MQRLRRRLLHELPVRRFGEVRHVLQARGQLDGLLFRNRLGDRELLLRFGLAQQQLVHPDLLRARAHGRRYAGDQCAAGRRG